MCGANRFDIPEDLSVAEVAEFGARPEFTTDEAAFIADATRVYSNLDVDTLSDQMHTLADRVEVLQQERDNLEVERDRLEAQIRELEEDQPDLKEALSVLETAEREVNSLRQEIESYEGRVADLKYSDLDDVVDEIENLANYSGLDSYLDDAENALFAVREELERV